MLHALNAVRRRARHLYQRLVLIAILASITVIVISYFNLDFCYKLLSPGRVNYICTKFRSEEFSGNLCSDLCSVGNFDKYQCPPSDMKTIVLLAVKNPFVYAIKLAKHIKNDLSWTDSKGKQRYPSTGEFQRMVKMHIMLSYNVSLDKNMISTLLNQEIDGRNPQQMEGYWRLFKDNNFVMSKLYEEDSIFPVVLGSCGPYYVTQHIVSIQPETGLMHYIIMDWKGRLKFAMQIMDFLYRLDSINPEPLKMCKINPQFFGLTYDKRLKYQTAQHTYSETQIDRILSDGSFCKNDQDCRHDDCLGKCDLNTHLCNGIQQNNNLQIVCSKVFKGSWLFPGLFSTSRTPTTLKSLIDLCSNPSTSSKHHWPHRQLAPTHDISIRIYNEIRRIYTEINFIHQI